MANDRREIEKLLVEILDAFNRHDLDAIMEFFADDATLDMPRGPFPWGQRFVGKAEIRAGLASRFTGIPDVHYGADRHWVCDDLAISEWTLTGTTTTGAALGGPRHGPLRVPSRQGHPEGRVLEDRRTVGGVGKEPKMTFHARVLAC